MERQCAANLFTADSFFSVKAAWTRLQRRRRRPRHVNRRSPWIDQAFTGTQQSRMTGVMQALKVYTRMPWPSSNLSLVEDLLITWYSFCGAHVCSI